MRTGRALLPTLLLILVAPVAGATAETAADEQPTLLAPQPSVWLKGAFGRVLGGDPSQPAGAHPSDTPLDTFIRKAPLSLEIRTPQDELIALSVVAHPLEGGAAIQLSDGGTLFEGPHEAGLSVVTATVTTKAHGTTTHAWTIDVPVQAGDVETLYQITPPPILLVSGQGEMSGAPGNGCYVYLCSDTGDAPLPRGLETLNVGVGETLLVQTVDGSGLVGWTGRLTADGGAHAQPVRASSTLGDDIDSVLTLSGLEPPAPGQWLLELRVDLDRHRGWLWHAYRLKAE